MKIFLLSCLLSVFSLSHAQSYYAGKVSTVNVFCHITFKEDSISGKLFYSRFRQEINIVGIKSKDKVDFSEFDNGKVIGIYSGRIYNGDSIVGTWSNSSGKKFLFYLIKITPAKYLEALEKKDINSITNSSFKNFVKGFSSQSLPFQFDSLPFDEYSQPEIPIELVKKYLKPDYDMEGFESYNHYFKGFVFYQPQYMGLIVFNLYAPGIAGVHNTNIWYCTYSYEGKLLCKEEIGCFCLDTDLGSNEYYATNEVIKIDSSMITVTSTHEHGTLIESDSPDNEEEPFFKKTRKVSLFNISGEGLLSKNED